MIFLKDTTSCLSFQITVLLVFNIVLQKGAFQPFQSIGSCYLIGCQLLPSFKLGFPLYQRDKRALTWHPLSTLWNENKKPYWHC